MVYIREAHPSDAWQLAVNVEEEVVFASPRDHREKTALAGRCARELGLEFAALVDGFDNAVEEAYTAWPDRLYVVDVDGRIVHKSGPGPFGFDPAEVEVVLERLLGPAARGPAAPD